MKREFRGVIAGWLLISCFSVAQTEISIIPRPVSLETRSDSFVLDKKVAVVCADPADEAVAAYFVASLTEQTGLSLPQKHRKPFWGRCILLTSRGADSALGDEGYELSVTGRTITITAPKPAGLFYGVQTLLQLIQEQSGGYAVPGVFIRDYPRFAWRGMHLDESRHFFGAAFVKKYIDLLALHKVNVFHWHLTDDQGWRIEIKKYPKLTEIGAWRKETMVGKNWDKFDGTPHGGFYTQQDIREIVEYARQRYVTIVPEIEMPGHGLAALASYPELSCTGGPFKVRTVWGVEPDVFCAGNDQVLAFLQDVLSEVLELFPSPFIHIGGDECPKERWHNCPKCQARISAEGLKDEHELQSWFVKHMEKYLSSKGRRLIGWDEILEGGLAPGATVMSWRGEEGGIAAAKSGHDVVMAPNSYTYFDYYQADPAEEPLAIGGFLPLEKVYSYNPTPSVLTENEQKHILGVQAQIWTEYIPNAVHVEYMAYPRGCALAEVAWTPLKNKNYEDFCRRLIPHLNRLRARNVNYRPLDPPQKIVGTWKSGQTSEKYQPMEWDLTPHLDGSGMYKIRFSYTGGTHRLDIQSAEILEDGKVIAQDTHPGITGGQTKDNTYTLEVPVFRQTAAYVLRATVRSDGGTDSNGNVYIRKNKKNTEERG
ncbi:MAG: beta-N-acetylhexosaminidase [Planctomycetales bacterium]|nr:beta-N-acetylhexosaminidase [Planctomycetales bacterium]